MHDDRPMTDKAEQVICPVMGNPIVRDVYTDIHGMRVYFCCPPCIEKFEAAPQDYLDGLPRGLAERLREALKKGGE